ncbi:MAG: response regulator transcription factor [Nitrospirota bacterium]
MKARVLVIDDEEDIRYTFGRFLEAEGYEPVAARGYDEAVAALTREDFDLIVADILLGGRTGLELLGEVHERGLCAPVVMVTGAPSIETAAEAVRLGAYDYLPKPVDIRELLAVIQNLQPRRTSETGTPWSLNTTTWILTTPDRAQHDLTKSELQILSTLAISHGEAVTRQQLYTALGIPGYSPETRSLDIQISRLRRRFTTEDYTIPIKTVHGIGYLFGEPIAVTK